MKIRTIACVAGAWKYVSPSRAPVLSFARYFQAPATQAIRTTDRSYNNWSILVTNAWKRTTDRSYNNWFILVTTGWKYAQLIDHISHNWMEIRTIILIDHITTDRSVLVTTEWKYALLIDHVTTDRTVSHNWMKIRTTERLYNNWSICKSQLNENTHYWSII